MATYTQLVDLVLDWSNRDTEVLSYRNIKTFINYGVDDAYRTLRIAPMEATTRYPAVTATQAANNANTLAIPSDAIQFHQLYLEDTDAGMGSTGREVYEPKSDLRSFYDPMVTKYGYRYFARDRNNLVLYPNFSEGDVYHLHYYRRFPEADARYSVTAANNTAGLLYMAADTDALVTLLRSSEGDTVFSRDKDLQGTFVTNPTGLPTGVYVGRLTSHWLRDQNEKVMLYGALKEAFSYLNEMEQMAMYEQKFMMEIQELNREDKMRMVLGGNIQTHFNGGGLI